MANSIGFTRGRINTLTCSKDKSQEIYWDPKTPGLGIRVTPAQVRAFVFQTRLHGKTIRITIGNINSWTLSQAQAEARRLKVLADQGIDLRDEKADKKAKAITRRLKNVQALVIWNEYIQERKHQWGTRHFNDHLDMVREGGKILTRGATA